jgi:DNA-directed RNA polymerase subunit RPC12/RpoP
MERRTEEEDFYFCITCNKRITGKEYEENLVTCEDCFYECYEQIDEDHVSPRTI